MQPVFSLSLNAEIISYDYCSEQCRNSCFSSVVEDRQTDRDKMVVECIAVGHQIREGLQME